MSEQTLLVVKPDGVQRALSGEIISRLEKAGLKIVAMKMLKASREMIEKHYTTSEEFLRGMGGKTIATYKEFGGDVMTEMGTTDELELGKKIREWLIDFLSSDPVVAVVFEGHHAVTQMRKIVGATVPCFANPGTIRGDYTTDAPDLANAKKRPVKNLVHASGSVEEAKSEIALWFKPEEIMSYKRCDEEVRE